MVLFIGFCLVVVVVVIIVVAAAQSGNSESPQGVVAQGGAPGKKMTAAEADEVIDIVCGQQGLDKKNPIIRAMMMDQMKKEGRV